MDLSESSSSDEIESESPQQSIQKEIPENSLKKEPETLSQEVISLKKQCSSKTIAQVEAETPFLIDDVEKIPIFTEQVNIPSFCVKLKNPTVKGSSKTENKFL